jgi:8-oxo-dGTP pyrophosphatase MutT (NUDIX family)
MAQRAEQGRHGVDAIAGAAREAARKGPPPVHLWNPPFCGDLDMRIASDGTWFYLKTPIGRPALVKLFASVLKREGDKYFLVTPIEKCGIVVEDAPFLAVELRAEQAGEGQVLHFRTNVDDWVSCGREHALRFEPEPETAGLKPYLHGAGRKPAGVAMTDVALSSGAMSEDFFHRARTRLTLEVPTALNDPSAQGKRGDLDLDPVAWERAGVTATRPAAVLVPVVDRSEPAVLLTLRTELPSHPGQIAFPGGKIEPHDRTPVEAALREAAEEIGLGRALIEPIGYLDLYLTFSGYRILPTVARVRPDYKLVLSAAEVAEAFEVPLAFLMDAQNHALHSRDWKGVTRRYYAIPFGQRYIWGVTAGILRNLYERIYET